MLKIGSTTLPLAGWLADPRRPDESRTHRVAAIRHLIQTYGLSAVELTADLGMFYPQIFGAEFYASVADLQQELGFVCSIHMPFVWVDLCSLNESIRRASVEGVRQVVEWARPVEVSASVLHLWSLVTVQVSAALEDTAAHKAGLVALMAQAQRSLHEICDFLDPGHLCVENLEDALFDGALPMIEQVGAGICLDVGHLACVGRDELAFWSRHQERIREVHLHDVQKGLAGERGPARDHLALGQGQVDYGGLLHELAQAGFDGPVILEVNSRADLEQSVEAVGAYI